MPERVRRPRGGARGTLQAVTAPARTGIRWDALVTHHVEALGGWVPLVDELERRLRLAGIEPPAHDAALKGLRRLTTREQGAGGQYGRWLLRCFGVPATVEEQLAFVAQYHSRFADLPTSLRRDQLRLWDRPPISESRQVAWVHVGLASVHHRRRELDLMRERLAAARALDAGPLAAMESALLAARVASDEGDPDQAASLMDEVAGQLEDAPAHLPYLARLQGQRAFQLTRASDEPGRYAAARALFEAIPAASGVPFVDYRRTAGLAYCTWKEGDAEGAAKLARAALDHAGDGGFVRFRVMALNLLARIVGGGEARALRRRAERLARSIEDAHLTEVARIRDA